MQEYVSDAIVLDSKPNGDIDLRVSLFTRRFGKLVGKAKSARKITSKLAGHLQPGNLVDVRLVSKNGLQITDALKKSALALVPSKLLALDRLLAEAEPDPRLWRMLASGTMKWNHILRLLGWDPQEAACERCGARPPGAFLVGTQQFFCTPCASPAKPEEVIYI